MSRPATPPPADLTCAFWTVKDAAAYLGVGVDAIYAACAGKGLRHVKLGHCTIRLRREWVDAWAEQQAVGQA